MSVPRSLNKAGISGYSGTAADSVRFKKTNNKRGKSSSGGRVVSSSEETGGGRVIRSYSASSLNQPSTVLVTDGRGSVRHVPVEMLKTMNVRTANGRPGQYNNRSASGTLTRQMSSSTMSDPQIVIVSSGGGNSKNGSVKRQTSRSSSGSRQKQAQSEKRSNSKEKPRNVNNWTLKPTRGRERERKNYNVDEGDVPPRLRSIADPQPKILMSQDISYVDGEIKAEPSYASDTLRSQKSLHKSQSDTVLSGGATLIRADSTPSIKMAASGVYVRQATPDEMHIATYYQPPSPAHSSVNTWSIRGSHPNSVRGSNSPRSDRSMPDFSPLYAKIQPRGARSRSNPPIGRKPMSAQHPQTLPKNFYQPVSPEPVSPTYASTVPRNWGRGEVVHKGEMVSVQVPGYPAPDRSGQTISDRGQTHQSRSRASSMSSIATTSSKKYKAPPPPPLR